MRWWKGSKIPQVLAPRILSCLSGGFSLLMMQLVFSSMISWFLLALPLPAYYLGGWKGLVEQNGEGGQWKIVMCPPVSGLLGGINVEHGRCQASGLVYSVYTQFEFFVVNGERGQWRISVCPTVSGLEWGE